MVKQYEVVQNLCTFCLWHTNSKQHRLSLGKKKQRLYNSIKSRNQSLPIQNSKPSYERSLGN